jgi:hypothetical protein
MKDTTQPTIRTSKHPSSQLCNQHIYYNELINFSHMRNNIAYEENLDPRPFPKDKW